jgi:hypothetical protein
LNAGDKDGFYARQKQHQFTSQRHKAVLKVILFWFPSYRVSSKETSSISLCRELRHTGLTKGFGRIFYLQLWYWNREKKNQHFWD